jgi:DNA mismatch endonuclease (patch repair protein)
MSRVRSRNTGLEKRVVRVLRSQGLRFSMHVPTLPGTPDVVFTAAKVAVFIDGDFWHGFRFPAWKSNLSPFWQAKIDANRRRDRRNFTTLRRHGWAVIRVWQHEVDRDLETVVQRIRQALGHPNRPREMKRRRLRRRI